MDVVLFTTQLSRGGAEIQLVRLGQALARRGWKVAVISILPQGVFGEELKAAGIPLYECSRSPTLSPPMALVVAARAALQLARWHPAVLVTFNYHGDLLGRVAGRIAGIRAIVASLRTAHAKTRFREKVYRATEALVDVTVSNSEAALVYMIHRNILTPAKTLVIPNGIVAAAWPAPIRREEARLPFGFPDTAFVWLAVGNLLPAKDYSTLLAAAKQCAAARPEFQLLIAGDGSPEVLASFRDQAARLGLDGRVQFLGIRTDVPFLLRACDAFVLSSAWEGMPNTVMEAMASGVPVVSTDAGGVRELVRQEVDGFIVPCGDPAALAERMLQMMALEPDARLGMGACGRDRIAQAHDHERITDRWERLLRQMIRATARPGAGRVSPGPAPADPGVAALPPPAFVLSLDFELMWGVQDKKSIADYGDHVLGERQAIPAMLEMFRRYGVKATWAAVGMTLFDSRAELLRHLPDQLPTYARQELNPYLALDDVGESERDDPYHFGLSLVRQILDCEGMELASHTFSHFYCMEAGQTEAQFRADLAASVAASERLAERPISIVFPRNQFNPDYLAACAAMGFNVFRGNDPVWMYRAMERDPGRLKRAARLLDIYCNLTGDHGFLARPYPGSNLIDCPSSRFLRPYSPTLAHLDGLRLRRIRQAMESAARAGKCYHLWWHPHNFGAQLRENLAFLEAVLRHHVQLRDRYGVVSMTMGDMAR